MAPPWCPVAFHWPGQHAKQVSVLYCAFGSEVILDTGRAQRLLEAFGNIPVLWALKKTPPGLSKPPTSVFVTAWSPQKAVLLGGL